VDIEELTFLLKKCGLAMTPKQTRTFMRDLADDPAVPVTELSFDMFMELVRKDLNQGQTLAISKMVDVKSSRRLSRRQRMSWKAANLVAHPYFDGVIILVIALVGVATGVQLSWLGATPPSDIALFLDATSLISNIVFTAEIFLKFMSYGDQPWVLFTDPEDGTFNTFDFLIVVMALAMEAAHTEGNIVAVGRLLRLVKVVLKVEGLRFILIGFVAGIRAVVPISASARTRIAVDVS
jgi:hypothetical protein